MSQKESRTAVRVYHTTYDGYYLIVFDNDEIIYSYEGLCHCPNEEHKRLIEKAIELGDVTEVNEYWQSAIAYGYVK